MRFGQRKNFRVRLGEVVESSTRTVASAPAAEREESRGTVANRIGITVAPVTAEQAAANEIPEDRRGLRVTEIRDEGPARNKLVQDDVLVAVINPTRMPLRNAQDLQTAISRVDEGAYISFQVYNVTARSNRIVSLRVGSQR
jgi:serine protease Do